MKLTLSLLIVSLCLHASAQKAPTPLLDTNAITKARAAALAFQATNVVVPVPMDTNSIVTYPQMYPSFFQVSGKVLYSTNLVQWVFARQFDPTQTNVMSFTNPSSEPHFWRLVLEYPNIIAITNTATNTPASASSINKTN